MGTKPTRYAFISGVVYYIKQLLKNPSMAGLSPAMKAMGLSNPDFLKKLMDKAIIQRTQSIKKDPTTGKDNFVTQIKVLDNPKDKIYSLYQELFGLNESVFSNEEQMKEDILMDKLSGNDYKKRGGINEEGADGGATNCAGVGGQYDAIAFGQKKKNGGTDVLDRGPISVMVNERQAKLLREYILSEEVEQEFVATGVGIAADEQEAVQKAKRNAQINLWREAQKVGEVQTIKKFYIGNIQKDRTEQGGYKCIMEISCHYSDIVWVPMNEEAEMGTAFGDFGYDDPGADTSDDEFWGKAKDHKNMLSDPNLPS